MQTTNLQDFFVRIGYNYRNDLEKLSTICKYTKTRVNNERTAGEMSYGSEQCFLVKAIAQSIEATDFFEIGTGRGTASYAVSLLESLERVMTIDIISFHEKRHTAIGYEAAHVSNHDLYEMIPYPEKEKIEFKHLSELSRVFNQNSGEFDLAFIDGNHTDFDVIMNDFAICNHLVRPGGLILFDDYHPDKFAVKAAADKVLQDNPQYTAELICFHGHLFEQSRAATDNGILMVTR
tara:strand:+ start:1698 stop:2402 length:705 start_codon:yes stop_codon:yes gene_type:complete